jgi:PKD repeat protein
MKMIKQNMLKSRNNKVKKFTASFFVMIMVLASVSAISLFATPAKAGTFMDSTVGTFENNRSISKTVFAQGETIYGCGNTGRSGRMRLRIRDPNNMVVHISDEVDGNNVSTNWTLPLDAQAGEWDIQVQYHWIIWWIIRTAHFYVGFEANPVLPTSCDVDMVLMIDSSDSLNSSDLQDIKKAAFESFVDPLLSSTQANIGIIDFDSHVVSSLAPTNDSLDIKNAIDRIGHILDIEYTNWDVAISKANSMLGDGDLIVIITDGNPTLPRGKAIGAAIAAANAAKNNGIRIISIGIEGYGILRGELNIDNLKAISGSNVSTVPPDAISVNTDVITCDVSDLDDVLFNLTSVLCSRSIVVQKFIDGEPAKDWEFTAEVTGGVVEPPSGFTDDTGSIVFNVVISPGETIAYINVTETMQNGYSFVGAVALVCSEQIMANDGIASLSNVPVIQNGCLITCIFNNTVNYPPLFKNPNPVNSSLDQEPSFVWSIDIEDPDGDNFNWTMECSNGQSNSINCDSNGTKELSLTDLEYDTEYVVWVNATDNYTATRKCFTFKTREKITPDTLDNFTASADGRFQMNLTWTADGGNRTYIEWNATENWSRGVGTEIYNDTGTSYQHTGLDRGIKSFYQAWSYNETDNTYSSLYAKANDTTANNQAPSQSNEDPLHSGTDVDSELSSISVNIADSEGDLMNWTIEASTGDSNSSSSPMGNGTISCDLTTPLSYDANIIWYVNITDGFDWTNKSYSFTVESEPAGGNNGDGGWTPPSEPTADGSGPYGVYVGVELTFDGSGSTGSITSYSWEFGDGNTGSGVSPTYVYMTTGEYTVDLTVTGPGGSNTDVTHVSVVEKPNVSPITPEVDGPQNGIKNTEYSYVAVSTDEDNDEIQYIFDWGDGETTTTAFLPIETITTQTHKWNAAGKYIIIVKAFDGQTESGAMEYTILIDIHIVGVIGHIRDVDSDGIYDMFYNITTGVEINIEQQKGGTYLIDENGDGEWDRVYDIETGEIANYDSTSIAQTDNTAIIALALLAVILLLISFLFIKWNQDKKNAQIKATSKKSQLRGKIVTKVKNLKDKLPSFLF